LYEFFKTSLNQLLICSKRFSFIIHWFFHLSQWIHLVLMVSMPLQQQR
jgi:hypothetical protein